MMSFIQSESEMRIYRVSSGNKFDGFFQIYVVFIPPPIPHTPLIPPSPFETLPKVLIITLRQREITHSPSQHFFENLFLPTREAESMNMT